MGEIKNFSKVNVYTVMTRMENLLTEIEDAIIEARENEEYLKADGCLKAIYTELESQFTEVIESPHLCKVVDEIDALLDDTEKYVHEHINMSESEIRAEYIDFAIHEVSKHPKAKLVRMKLNDKIMKDEFKNRDEITEFAMNEFNNEIAESLVDIFIDDVLSKVMIGILSETIEEIKNDLEGDLFDDEDSNYDMGD